MNQPPTPLYNRELEQAVLSALMQYKNAYPAVKEQLCLDCFTTDMHQNVYKAISALGDRGDGIDLITVMTEMRGQGTMNETFGPYELTKLAETFSGHIEQNVLILANIHARNKVHLLAAKLSAQALNLTIDIVESIEEIRTGLAEIFNYPSRRILNMQDVARSLYEDHIDKNLADEGILTGAPTGFKQFDNRGGGLQAGNLVIIGGETSQGKTSLALNIAVTAARAGHPIAIYSMEMTGTELFARMTAAETGLPARKTLYGKLTGKEILKVDAGVSKLYNLPIYFDDKSTSNIDIILASIRMMVLKYEIKGVVIDYLQILNVNMKGANKEQQMGEVSRLLKNIAKDLGIWVIALSQLRRDEVNHIPTMTRLRDSGQIAEAADIVMLVYRPEVFRLEYPAPLHWASPKGTAMIDVAKGRNIGLMKFVVGFDAESSLFYEMEKIPKTEGVVEEEAF